MPTILVVLVLVLLVGAYGIGRVLSSSVEDADVTAEVPDGVDIGDTAAVTRTPRPQRPRKPSPSPTVEPSPETCAGAAETVLVGGASASCEAESSVDSAGNPVSYGPQLAHDQNPTTAWRCPGGGAGQSITLALPDGTEVVEVGLIPGYAKTDPASGVDRYAENNRITRVRWTFSQGTSVLQRLDGSATNRALQSRRIPVTDSDWVVLEVLASVPGSRDTIAVSEVSVGRAAP
ncbi:MAG: NADase-type glycan-binding domain-containing protein [Nocardioides sp.]